MPDSLLVTKHYTPAPHARLVGRTRLVQLLDQAWRQGKKLTLISAPAGYGKTTLIVQWLSQLKQPAAWLALDENDNDRVKFLAYLIAAIRQVFPTFGASALPLLQSPQTPPDEVLITLLVNEMAALDSRFILALDDYHAIHERAIHQQVAFLLEHQPPQLHLLLITREDPLLPIARLRGRGEVAEIRQEALRFTPQEASEFLQGVMGLDLSAGSIAALEGRTEGWIAGLQLAGLSLQGRENPTEAVQAFAGSHRFILDYLVEEVFEQQPQEIKTFLLKTCLLERMRGGLCDAVVGGNSSQALLEKLEQANLFIVPLDSAREWYRYHHLFMDVLRHRLRMEVSISEASLHQKASQWYEQNDLVREAIQHAFAAHDWERAAALLSTTASDLLKSGEVTTVIRWYETFPKDVLLSNPKLCFDACWPLLLGGRFEAAADLLERAEQAAQQIPPFLGEVAAAQSYLARAQGDHPRMVQKSQQALALLPKASVNSRGLVATNLGLAYWHMGKMKEAETHLHEALEAGLATGNHYSVLTAMIFLARVLAVRGQLLLAASQFRQIIQQGRGMPVTALAHLDLSMLHYEWNELEASDEHLQQAIQLSERSRNDEYWVAGYMMLSRLRLGQRDFVAARQALELARNRVQGASIPAQTAARLASAEVELFLALGDLISARRSSEGLSIGSEAHPFYRFLSLTRARLALALKENGAAEQLAALQEQAAQSDWVYGMIAAGVLQAVAAENSQAGLQFLAKALDLGVAEGFLRVFADAGAGLAPLLQAAARQGLQPDYVGGILAVMGGKKSGSAAGPADLVEPLSEREIEVLRLVIAGLSNREIARRLFISPGTAKTHIHNICGKLDVHNRTEAAVRAKELNLA